MRHGYYVEGLFFANRYAQACGRAQFLADTYGRPVLIVERAPTGLFRQCAAKVPQLRAKWAA